MPVFFTRSGFQDRSTNSLSTLPAPQIPQPVLGASLPSCSGGAGAWLPETPWPLSRLASPASGLPVFSVFASFPLFDDLYFWELLRVHERGTFLNFARLKCPAPA